MLKRAAVTVQDINPLKISTAAPDMQKAFGYKLLQEYCRSQKLAVYGNKAVMIERIRRHWGYLDEPLATLQLTSIQKQYLENTSFQSKISTITGTTLSIDNKVLRLEGKETSQVEAALSSINQVLAEMTTSEIPYDTTRIDMIQKLLCNDQIYIEQKKSKLKVYGPSAGAIQAFHQDAQDFLWSRSLPVKFDENCLQVPVSDFGHPRWTSNLQLYRPQVVQPVKVDLPDEEQLTIRFGNVALFNLDVGRGQWLGKQYSTLFLPKVRSMPGKKEPKIVESLYLLKSPSVLTDELPRVVRIVDDQTYKVEEQILTRQVTEKNYDIQVSKLIESPANVTLQEDAHQIREVRYIYSMDGYEVHDVQRQNDRRVTRYTELIGSKDKIQELQL